MARRISRPISKSIRITHEISEGNYDIRFEGQPKTKELSELVTSINHLADSLKKQEGLRKQLTADVAHELRTPLTTVSTHLEAMMEGVWSPTYERLNSCYDEINRISKLVADLESLNQVENENIKLNKTPVDLYDLVTSISQRFQIAGRNKNIAISVLGSNVIAWVDENRIWQVISNLLSNAVKYTQDNGQIKITVEDGNTLARIVVEDNGIGIPEEELPFIFERFYRADKSRNRKTGGAGIGLAVVKSIIEAHKGSIDVSSKIDIGSQFTISLPKN